MIQQRIVKIKRLCKEVQIPEYQSNEAAGFDVRWFDKIIDSITIPPGKQAILDTGLSFSLPRGFELQIRPRSGLAAKNCISITNSPGTLDADYRDELKIILINLGQDNFRVKRGDRIAQCVLSPVHQAIFCDVEDFNEDDMSRDRGGGFGSTGIS